MVETNEEFERHIKDANDAHARRFEYAKLHSSQIQAFSSDAMKAPALVGVGGVVALLGFYSANYDRLKGDAAAMDAFGDMLLGLFMSLVLTVAAPAFAYLSQYAYVVSIYSEDHQWEYPYVVRTRRSRIYSVSGDICRIAAILLIAASIGCLIYSGALFFQVVK